MSVRPRLGLLAYLWLAIVEGARSYVGGHYPSDLIGGAALGTTLVSHAQVPSVARRAARRVVGWANSSPWLFYTAAFLLSYQIVTVFFDIRTLASGLSEIGKMHDLLQGSPLPVGKLGGEL